MKVYGIPNCNTIKKALDWLRSSDISSEFHDYKKKGISKEKLEAWSKEVGFEKLINKKGTTWRALLPDQQKLMTDERNAIELMMEKPSIIKRPVIEGGERLLVGFDEGEYKVAFKKT